MKYLILIFAVLAFAIWPLNYFSANQNSDFTPKTVFEPDYQGRQLILRNINLYPNIFMARFFQNKALVVSNKYFDNLFDFIDPNYYFFGSHPREIVSGQNYTRLPLFTILPLLWFVFKSRNKYKRVLLFLLSFSVLGMSFFTNHHVYDFVLWIFFFPMISIGLYDIFKTHKSLGKAVSFLLFFEALSELFLSLK